jgi:aryl-phospho-beta-D-glucosidase BglC (GH1 family)
VLKPAVDYATSKNLYVVVDYHQIDDTTTGTSSADAVTFWKQMAPVFSAYSNVIYEAFNEPIDASGGGWTAAFQTQAQMWVDTI